jgi:hypothetical protein
MPMGFIGYVMKNNIKVSEFPCVVSTMQDGSQRVTYDVYDFVGTKGLARRNARRLFLTKKRFITTKIFRYSDDWDTLTDKGCISYWDQTSQAQIPVKVLKNSEAYKEVVDKQKMASDVLYYCLDAYSLVDQLMTPPKTIGLKDFFIPSLLVGGIIMTAVMNVYAASQYLQAWGVIKGTTGVLGALQHYFDQIGGLPAGMILFPMLSLTRKKENTNNPKKPKPVEPRPYDNVSVIIKQKGLATSKITTQIYKEIVTSDDGGTEYRDFIILESKKRRFKLYVDTGDDYILKGITYFTLFIEYNQYEELPFKQLPLSEMGIEPSKAPINEDMGKVLSKVYQDNINARAKPEAIIAGLTKLLFYAFIFSVILYAALFLINLIMEGMALSAFNSASAGIHALIHLHA